MIGSWSLSVSETTATIRLLSVFGDLRYHLPLPLWPTMKIFIVEDNAIFAKVVWLHLRALGHSVTIFDNAEIALLALSRVDVKLVLLDNFVGKLKAVEIVSAIRRTAKQKDVPVVVMTSAITEYDIGSLLAMDVITVVSKDEMSVLKSAITIALEQAVKSAKDEAAS